MGIPHIALEAGGIYHIYNHSVGSDNLFREDENYLFFLRKIESRVTLFSEVLTYCLMPNHFHLILRIKDSKDLLTLWKEKLPRLKASREKRHITENAIHDLIDELIVRELGGLFNSYAQAFNKRYRRMGSLFKESFPRKLVDSELYLLRLICYIHNNPVAHGFTARREDWKYSSYNSFLSGRQTFIPMDEILQLFGGMENFILLHNKYFSED